MSRLRAARQITFAHNCLNSALIVLVAAMGYLMVSGQASIASVHGTSMNPTLHAGQLGIVWHQPSYRAGDVVSYHSAWSGHDRVLHRVRAVRSGALVMRGDNNPVDDPQRVHSGDIAGRLAYVLPFGARGALTALACMFGLCMLLATSQVLLEPARGRSRSH